MVILALISAVLIISGLYYIISDQDSDRKPFIEPMNKRQELSANTISVTNGKLVEQSKNDEDLEYWLRQLCSINEKLNDYCAENTDKLTNQKSMHDIDACKKILTTLNPVLINSNTNKIISPDSVFSDSQKQIILLIEKLICQINQLLNDSSILTVIKEKLDVLIALEDKLTSLMADQVKLASKNLNEDQANEIIEDTMGIIPTLKLAESEYHNFLDFYFNYKLCISLIPFFEIQLDQINTHTKQVLEFLVETDEALSSTKLSYIVNIQSEFLELYRSFFNYFHYLYTGLEIYLNALKSSSLREVYQSKSTIIELLEVIEELLDTCRYFAPNKGTSENEFNIFFKKVREIACSNKPKTLLSIGARESFQIFFETRAESASTLIKNQHLLKIDQILSRVSRSFQSL